MGQKLVLYHKNCVDGWVAAVMAHQALGSKNTDYLPVQYGEITPHLPAYETVYILDFSIFPIPDNAVMLDHHATAMSKAGFPDASYYSTPEPYVVLDIMKSGARLAQEYFEVAPHWIVDYAEDHDLWRFNLPDSRDVRAGLNLLPRSSIVLQSGLWLNADLEHIKQQGRIILEYDRVLVERAAESATDLVFRVNGQSINGKMVNSATLISDVGKRICEKYDTDVACMWFQTGPDTVVVSLRGKNVRAIAEAFGGGGHEEAAGFQLNDWEQIKELLHGDLSADRIMVPSYHLGDTNGF